MLFNSFQFLCFFPIVVLVYYLVPKKLRHIWLLVMSYYFYMCWSAKYALLIGFSTIITYLSGILMDKVREKCDDECKRINYCKMIVASSCVCNLGILIFFKYFSWVVDNISSILGQPIELPWSIVLPVGISFYTFQAVGYTIDVYRGEIKAEKNFIKYALFVSFFPQLMSGPIGRAKNLLSQLDCEKDLDYDNVRDGLLLMLWGFFEKIVIADKATILVDTVYNNYAEHHGSVILLATFAFAIQIYCDFGGYSHIAIGTARVLNIHLMDNFRQPYFALNIKEFWNRWHISLSSWFRDYLYIPLGGNRCSTLRKYANLFVTFFVSGLWHGASWHFVAWGTLHGLYQIVSGCTVKVRIWIVDKLKIKTNCFSYRLWQRMITFVGVSFIWLFFRAESLSSAFRMCKKIVVHFNPSILLGEQIYNLGLNGFQLSCLLISILILLIVDYLHEKGRSITAFLQEQNLVFRWFVYYLLVFVIIISVVQTYGKDVNSFIYFQF